MSRSRSFWLALLLSCGSPTLFAASSKKCVAADQAARLLNKAVCVTAHVYDIVELSDGTRFLDVCSPETPDARCGFTIVSMWGDRDQVGELQQYRGQNVNIRGIVRPMNGRAGIVLNHARQFQGGPPRFRPNPLLARGFDAMQDRPPVSDPNLRHHGGHRAFMNSRDQEPLPASK